MTVDEKLTWQIPADHISTVGNVARQPEDFGVVAVLFHCELFLDVVQVFTPCNITQSTGRIYVMWSELE